MSAPSRRGLGDVLTDITHNVERLARAQLHLEAAGVLESAAAMAKGMGLVVLSVALALLATMLVLLGALARLFELMPPWEAFLLVAASAGVLSAVVAVVGVRTLRRRHGKARLERTQLERDPWRIEPLT
jgi:hypothetical protein